MRTHLVLVFVAFTLVVTVTAKKNSKEQKQQEKFNKYSKEANVEADSSSKKRYNDDKDDYRPPKNYATSSERLFKMQKIHNIWQKGQKSLNEAKLKALFHDLKVQDKQEIAFKKIKSQGKDSDGIQEAALRAQLAGIIERYGLLNSFPDMQPTDEDNEQIERLFKDKKLNKLWNKIEAAGLDEKEMKILKEELNHHQLKIDQYYAFVDNLHESRDKTREIENSLSHFLEDEVEDVKKGQPKGKLPDDRPTEKHDQVRIKHQELKENLDELTNKIRSKLNEKEFTDERAIKLWELAKNADFDKVELESLRAELHHFEHRLRKLSHLNGELELKDNPDAAKQMKSKVADYERKVNKIHNELRGRIARRSEL